MLEVHARCSWAAWSALVREFRYCGLNVDKVAFVVDDLTVDSGPVHVDAVSLPLLHRHLLNRARFIRVDHARHCWCLSRSRSRPICRLCNRTARETCVALSTLGSTDDADGRVGGFDCHLLVNTHDTSSSRTPYGCPCTPRTPAPSTTDQSHY
ncbi:hypothetical protein BGZ61DRAFT_109075 [Ilyonectria robusta]|uniref:uncharacterized protein n=1 Tax=Ilyonectria robusta TaxID=1079257 RepID=UPI001E8EB9C4|nr:uncharacterized protein BGZ61DRAFT_109075 [Ilyonectria robusta]KAH8670723.1 hypothetical protein BGZ61DRAFT_109075 [Ilyonectria robusta]